uniref:Secreted protein n=1 Tax=Anopheles darlingi TaxID=43151 RepID=A0A2M4DIK2_ANODA
MMFAILLITILVVLLTGATPMTTTAIASRWFFTSFNRRFRVLGMVPFLSLAGVSSAVMFRCASPLSVVTRP